MIEEKEKAPAPPAPVAPARDPSEPSEGDSPAVAEFKERLRKARAERRRRDEAAAEAKQLEELKRQVELEEMGLADEIAIEEAVAKYGPLKREVHPVYTDMGVVIVKRGNPVLFKRFQDSGKTSTVEMEKLVLPNVVHPDKGRFDVILDKLPGTLLRCANAVAVLFGVRSEENEGKS